MSEGRLSGSRPSGGAAYTGLIALLVVEAIAVSGLAVYLLLELLTQPASSLGGGIAIVVIGFLAAIWLVAIVIGALRRRTWIRGAAVTWQLVQIAVAIGCFQGIFARSDLGWLLLLPALIGIFLLLSRPVTEVLRPE